MKTVKGIAFLLVTFACLWGCAPGKRSSSTTLFDDPLFGKATVGLNTESHPPTPPVDSPERLAHDTKMADREYGKGNYSFGTPYVAKNGCLTRPIYLHSETKPFKY